MARPATDARFAPLFALWLLACCSPMVADAGQPSVDHAAANTVHPVSGLPVADLTVMSHGTPHSFRVEVAKSAAEQARGLMFRSGMGPDEGMIFPMSPPRPASFWMKNTVIALDIVFIGPDRRITNIAANAIPYDLKPLSSLGPVMGVLELNGGRAAELGIVPGDSVNW